MKINIGAGSTHFDGFLNCDYSEQYNPDYVFDLEKDRWPFEDNSVEYVVAHHVLEHLGEGYFHALKEMYRVCKSGAIIDVRVPHHKHDNFFHDATHRRAITAYGFNMFSQKQNHRDFVANAATSRLGQYLHIDIELMEYSYVVDKVYEGLLNYASNEQIECYAFEKNNVISEVWMKSMVIKGTREEQIKAYYRNYLKREVDEQGLNIYLNSGLSMEEILKKILSSEEYRNIR